MYNLSLLDNFYNSTSDVSEQFIDDWLSLLIVTDLVSNF